ncbi:MAG: class I SAM-dependent methyltransferase [bacterium]
MSLKTTIAGYDDLPLWSAPFGMTLLDTIRMKKGINVLDIGSGGGFPMLEIAERMGKSCMVYGLDPSEDAIRMISEKKESRGIINARILKGFAEDIPFPDEYFGLIVANNGLNNVQDQSRALDECFRVADEDAQMVLTVNLPMTMIEFYDIYEEVLASLDLKLEIKAMHDHIHDKRKPVEYIRESIETSGFTVRSVNIDGFKMRFNDAEAFFSHYLIKNAFVKPWQAFLPPGRVDEIFDLISKRLNESGEAQGGIIMSVPYVCFDCLKSHSSLVASNS